MKMKMKMSSGKKVGIAASKMGNLSKAPKSSVSAASTTITGLMSDKRSDSAHRDAAMTNAKKV